MTHLMCCVTDIGDNPIHELPNAGFVENRRGAGSQPQLYQPEIANPIEILARHLAANCPAPNGPSTFAQIKNISSRVLETILESQAIKELFFEVQEKSSDRNIQSLANALAANQRSELS